MSRNHEDIILGWLDEDQSLVQISRFRDAGVDTVWQQQQLK